MKASEFCYWLQGYFEIKKAAGEPIYLTAEQSEIVERHLALVFLHDLDPKQGPPEHQAKLQEVHDNMKKMRC